MTKRRFLVGVLGLSAAALAGAWLFALHVFVAHSGAPVYGYLMEGSINGPVILLLAALLATRRPNHPISWIFVGMAAAAGFQQFFGGYEVEALLAAPGQLPAGQGAAALSSLMQAFFVILLLLMINLFPTGSPVPGRWRYLIWAFIPLTALAVVEVLVVEIEVGSVTLEPIVDSGTLATFISASGVVILLLLLATVAHVVGRFRRSRGLEREQLKWFVFSFVGALSVLLGEALISPTDTFVGTVIWSLAPLAVLGSIAVAVLRYRLYEIDRIISRTVGYGLVVAMLAALYGLVVVGIPTLLPAVEESQLLVAAATLVAFFLFNPLRRRVLSWVDRRFYRSRYDAERVVEEFSSRLRDEIDLEELTSDWAGVVQETVQPASMSVWVREP